MMVALVLQLATAAPNTIGGCTDKYRLVEGQAFAKGPDILLHPRNSSALECCSLCTSTAGCAGWSFLAGTHRICHVATAAAKLSVDKSEGVVSGVALSPVRWRKKRMSH